MSNPKEKQVDDLQQSYLIRDAFYDGVLEIPKLKAFDGDLNVETLVPFSLRKKFENRSYALAFFEKDPEFKEVVQAPENYIDEIKKFKFVVSPDNGIRSKLSTLEQKGKLCYVLSRR